MKKANFNRFDFVGRIVVFVCLFVFLGASKATAQGAYKERDDAHLILKQQITAQQQNMQSFADGSAGHSNALARAFYYEFIINSLNQGFTTEEAIGKGTLDLIKMPTTEPPTFPSSFSVTKATAILYKNEVDVFLSK